MHITHSFVGTALGKFRYLFFVLYEDYVDFDRQFVQELRLQLERFARNLESEGAVVQPFRGDVERTRSHVLGKDWTDKEQREITRTPSLLMISNDFDDFSPRTDPWIVFHFGEGRFGDHRGLEEIGDTLAALTESVLVGEGQDAYSIAKAFAQESPQLTRLFTAQPGIFGFSINLVEAGQQLRDWIGRRRRRIGRQPDES